MDSRRSSAIVSEDQGLHASSQDEAVTDGKQLFCWEGCHFLQCHVYIGAAMRKKKKV